MVNDKNRLYDNFDVIKDMKEIAKRRTSQPFSRFSVASSTAINIAGSTQQPQAEQINFKPYIGNPADTSYGTVGFLTQAIFFDQYGSNYNSMTINGDVTFTFEKLQQGWTIIFTIDFIIDTGTPPTLTWPSTILNLPTLPTLSDTTRVVMTFVGVSDENEERFTYIGGTVSTGGGGGGQTPWLSNIDAATFDLLNLGNLEVNQGGKIALDGDLATGDTYITSSGVDIIEFTAGGNAALRVNSTNIEVQSGYQVFLDGLVHDYWIVEESNQVRIGAGGATHFTVTNVGVAVPATEKVWFDGGFDTYIHESTKTPNDTISVFTGGTEILKMDLTGISIPQGKKFFLDGTLTGNTYITQSGASPNEVLEFDVDGTAALRITDTNIQVQAGMHIKLDGLTGDYWITDESNQVRIGAGGITSFTVTDTGVAVPFDNRVYFDGGIDTYIESPIADTLIFTVGTEDNLILNTVGMAVPSGKRIELDGTLAGDTYITESGANIIEFVAGGSATLRVNASAIEVQPNFQIFLDGITHDFWIVEESSQVRIGAGGATAFTVVSSGISVPATNNIWLDGGGDTYFEESSPNVVKLFVGGNALQFPSSAGGILSTGEAWVMGDGIKAIFNPNATTAGINVGAHTADPSPSPVNGDIIYNSTSNTFRFRENGAWVELGGAAEFFGPWTAPHDAGGQNLVNLANIQIISGQGLYFDYGGDLDTLIFESSEDILDTYVGGEHTLRITPNEVEVIDANLRIPTNKGLYFDGGVGDYLTGDGTNILAYIDNNLMGVVSNGGYSIYPTAGHATEGGQLNLIGASTGTVYNSTFFDNNSGNTRVIITTNLAGLGDRAFQLINTGDATIHLAIPDGAKFYLDGQSNSYFSHTSSDLIQVFTNDVSRMYWSNTEVACLTTLDMSNNDIDGINALYGFGGAEIQVNDNLNMLGNEIHGVTKLVQQTVTTNNIEIDTIGVIIDGDATTDTASRIDFRLAGSTRVQLSYDVGNDERMLFNGCYLDLAGNLLSGADIIDPQSNQIRFTDATVIKTVTGTMAIMVNSAASPTISDASHVGTIVAPFVNDNTKYSTQATNTTLDDYFGDANGCTGYQYDATEAAGTGRYRHWVKLNNVWVANEMF